MKVFYETLDRDNESKTDENDNSLGRNQNEKEQEQDFTEDDQSLLDDLLIEFVANQFDKK